MVSHTAYIISSTNQLDSFDQGTLAGTSIADAFLNADAITIQHAIESQLTNQPLINSIEDSPDPSFIFAQGREARNNEPVNYVDDQFYHCWDVTPQSTVDWAAHIAQSVIVPNFGPSKTFLIFQLIACSARDIMEKHIVDGLRAITIQSKALDPVTVPIVHLYKYMGSQFRDTASMQQEIKFRINCTNQAYSECRLYKSQVLSLHIRMLLSNMTVQVRLMQNSATWTDIPKSTEHVLDAAWLNLPRTILDMSNSPERHFSNDDVLSKTKIYDWGITKKTSEPSLLQALVMWAPRHVLHLEHNMFIDLK